MLTIHKSFWYQSSVTVKPHSNCMSFITEAVWINLTLIMQNFLNEIILPTFLALSIISFRDIKMKT